MSRTDLFTGLADFLAVARHASFRAAGADLGVTPSAVSQAVRALETKIGLPLFQRTTRKVALTEAGARLLAQVSPAASNIGEALEVVGALRRRPAGLLRLSVPRIALDLGGRGFGAFQARARGWFGRAAGTSGFLQGVSGRQCRDRRQRCVDRYHRRA